MLHLGRSFAQAGATILGKVHLLPSCMACDRPFIVSVEVLVVGPRLFVAEGVECLFCLSTLYSSTRCMMAASLCTARVDANASSTAERQTTGLTETNCPSPVLILHCWCPLNITRYSIPASCIFRTPPLLCVSGMYRYPGQSRARRSEVGRARPSGRARTFERTCLRTK